MLEGARCTVCGATATRRCEAYPGYQAPATFAIYACPSCFTSFSMPRVDASSLYDAIYRLGAAVPEYDRYWKYEREVDTFARPLAYLAAEEPAYWSVQEALRLLPLERSIVRIVEIGSGLGYLTYALRVEGFEAVGLEISAEAVRRATARFGAWYSNEDVGDHSHTHESFYDAAILTEVIEHVEEPVRLIREVRTLVRPGGSIMITTPNKSFFPETAIWASTPPPIHACWFAKQSLEHVAKQADMAISFIDFTDFYRAKPVSIDCSSARNFATSGPVLDETGEIVTAGRPEAGASARSAVRRFLRRIPYARLVAAALRARNTSIRSCGRDGLVLGAVMTKPH